MTLMQIKKTFWPCWQCACGLSRPAPAWCGRRAVGSTPLRDRWSPPRRSSGLLAATTPRRCSCSIFFVKIGRRRRSTFRYENSVKCRFQSILESPQYRYLSSLYDVNMMWKKPRRCRKTFFNFKHRDTPSYTWLSLLNQTISISLGHFVWFLEALWNPLNLAVRLLLRLADSRHDAIWWENKWFLSYLINLKYDKTLFLLYGLSLPCLANNKYMFENSYL